MSKTSLHPKITHCIEMMLLNSKVNLPYYGEFNLCINFFPRPNDPNLTTAGVNVTNKGMNHYYNPKFIDGLTQNQVNFLVLHETFHLLFSHPKRTRMGGFDHQLSNIAQDMIINQILVQDIKPDFIDIPKNEEGKNSALMMPKEYEGEWVFEVLYDFLKKAKEDSEKRRLKKEDEKIFAELFCLKNRPADTEVDPKSYKGQLATFLNTLEPKSKDEADMYMNNFTRRVLVSLESMLPVKLFGHTSSIIPDGEPLTYNDNLSLKRAELFKNGIIQNIDDYMDVYALCMAIYNDEESNLSKKDMIDYIVKYEEITNKTMKKKREKELNDSTSQEDEVVIAFKSYRFTELNKMSESSLNKIIATKKLTPPNIQQEKLKYVQLAQNMIDVEGKGSDQMIILNDSDDQPAKLRTEIAHLPQYKPFVHIADAEKKQLINRRVTYEFDESFDNQMGGGSSPESENQGNRDDYGQNGKNGQDSYGLDSIFDKMESNDGQFMDQHMPDDVPAELREQMVQDIREKLKARGLETSNIESTLGRLKKRKKDYLKEIKRGVSMIKGNIKQRSITKPSRRGIKGLKGNKKIGAKINVMLDTSGSMSGYWEKALSFIFRSDIEVNLIQVDTQVHGCENIKNKADLKKVVIKGCGGTTLQPGIDYIKKNYPMYNTLILTDGYTDAFDFGGYKGKVLIISNSSECPIAVSNGKIKQIIVEE